VRDRSVDGGSDGGRQHRRQLVDLSRLAAHDVYATRKGAKRFRDRERTRRDGEVQVDVKGEVTQRSVLDALEARYPMLRGTIRDHDTGKRRPFVRFFACAEDLSHESPDTPLPEAVAEGREPLLVIGAIAGG